MQAKPPKNVTVMIRLDEDTNAQLDDLAADLEGNRSATIRRLIRQAASAAGQTTRVSRDAAAHAPR